MAGGVAPRIIGISGFMRTGKDSVAALLNRFGYQRVSFADPLRKVALDIDPYIFIENDEEILGMLPPIAFDRGGPKDAVRYSSLLQFLGYERAKELPDFRRYLQRLGTEGIRGNFGEDAWVNMAIKAIEEMGPNAKVVLPDVRFPNEAVAVWQMKGEIWRTERPGYEGGTHPSEAMVLEIEPDVTLHASSLLDTESEKGLGTLILERLGAENERTILSQWAHEILGDTVSV